VIRILVLAPSSLARAGLEALVRGDPAIEIVGSTPSLAGLATSVQTYKPDAVVAVLNGPLLEAPGELLDLADGVEPPGIVLLVSEPGAGWAGEAIRSGVRAVLPADVSGPELAAAIHAAAAGLVVVHPHDVEVLVSAQLHRDPASSEALTSREIEVLGMLAEGQSNKNIAWRLGISEHTVKFHVASIMSKLHAGSRTEAVTIGLRRGLILI
jgi:DNA-binding NarL/FixJ family response regulator